MKRTAGEEPETTKPSEPKKGPGAKANLDPSKITEGVLNTPFAYLCIGDGRCEEAITWYETVFGAKLQDKHYMDPTAEKKKVMHAKMNLGASGIMLADHIPEMANSEGSVFAPATADGPVSVSVNLSVTNVDGVWALALANGAKTVVPLEDQFWGDRFGVLRDPFNVTWGLNTPTDVPAGPPPTAAGK